MSKELLEKFKKLYLDKYGIELTNEEATRMSTDLINLMKVLLKKENDQTILSSSERSEYATIETQNQYL